MEHYEEHSSILALFCGQGDDLLHWVLKEYRADLASGLLHYYQTKALSHWHAALCKNTSHKLTPPGESILFNLDNDQFVNPTLPTRVREHFVKQPKSCFQVCGCIRVRRAMTSVSVSTFLGSNGCTSTECCHGFRVRPMPTSLQRLGQHSLASPGSIQQSSGHCSKGHGSPVLAYASTSGGRKLAYARGGGGGGRSSPQKEGGGSGKGALVTGHSKGASLKSLMMTYHLRRKAARKNFFRKKFPHGINLKMISASWGSF